MKQCHFCGQDIPQLARKCFHCHSYQSPGDTPKASFDLATLVISFVGVSASIAIIVAGVFAYFGYKNVSELRAQADDILKQTKTTVEGYDTKLKDIGSAQKSFNKIKSDLDSIFIHQQFDRFQQAMDSIVLSELYKSPDLIDALKEISNSTKTVDKLDDKPKDIQEQIVKITEAVLAYKEGDFKKTIDILVPLNDNSLYKHRILYACYKQLYKDADKNNNVHEKTRYIEKYKQYAAEAYRIGTKINKKSVTSKVNFAMSLISEGTLDDLANAKKLLDEAKKESPFLSPISYNIAVYWVKMRGFNNALNSLDEAKSLGDFATESDCDYFSRDVDFDPLRKEAEKNPLYQERLNKILTIPKLQ